MKISQKFRVSALSALIAVALVSAQDSSGKISKGGKPERVQITVSLKDYQEGLRFLQSRDYDIAGVDVNEKLAYVITTEEEAKFLEDRGYQISRPLKVDALQPDSEYKTPAEIESILKKYAETFPWISQAVSIGKSIEGRDIWAMKITSDPAHEHPEKPKLLINAMHHAREVMSPEVPLDMIDYLLTHYGRDSQVNHWVDANEIWVVPMLNVDGNNKVWVNDPWWRKNTRGGYGVDINRNYPYGWKSCNGSSGSQWSDTYRGESAGSEPETQVLMGLVAKVRPVFDISFHSFSELVIYPYGCPDRRTETKEVVEPIGKKLAELIPSDNGKGTYTAGTPWETLYAVDGGDIDWMYHEYQVIPYVIELNSGSQGFQPNYRTWRDKTVTKVRAAWTHLLNRLEGSGIRGRALDQKGNPVAGAQILIERTGSNPYSQTYPAHTDGTYHVVLNPGRYTVTFQAPGYETVKNQVLIESKRVDLNVNLALESKP